MKCAKCNFENPVGLKYCGMCGTRIGVPCPQCGFNNPDNFRYCGMCGTTLPVVEPAAIVASTNVEPVIEKPAFEPGLFEGERRVVTVVMADVFGSTNLLEQIGNEVWVDLMNRVLSSLEAEIYRFGGQVDQFRGDGLVAFFGAETASEDDPERAVLAALSMQQRMAGYEKDLPVGATQGVKLRVGVNTGEVIVAGIGDGSQHREDTAMGIGITIAARMETAAEPGTVLASEYTYRQIESRFLWQPLGQTTVKGLSLPIEVYRPLALSSDNEKLSDLEVFGYSIELVGRDDEFALIRHKVHELEAGKGSVILLSGETGIGKNGLIRNLRQYVRHKDALLAEVQGQDSPTNKPVLWLFSRSRTYDWNWPYSLWIDLLNNWLGVYSGQNPEEIRKRLHQKTERIWGERMNEFYPYLATLLALPLEEEFSERVIYLDGERMRYQFKLAIRSWLEELVKLQPVIFVATGMEWSDPSSIDMIDYCLPLVEEAPILWLFAYRPEQSAPVWELQTHIEKVYSSVLLSIELHPLSDEQCDKLIQSLVGAKTLPRGTRNLLIKNSEGRPAYIIEIFRSLIEKEILVQNHETNGWKLTRDVSTLDMPANLHRLLQARFDRLGDEEHFVLQIAAIVGPVFWTKVLQGVITDNIPLRERLAVLKNAQLIEQVTRVPDLGMQYTFKTNLIREAAYESMLSSQRDAYHLKAAQVLEDLTDLQTRGQYQALIAYHYRKGGDRKKELFYTMWAAEKAQEFFASAEAIEHYTRALDLLNEMESGLKDLVALKALRTQKFEVLSGRYLEFYKLGEVDAGDRDAKELLEIAERTVDEPTWTIDALLRQPETTLGDQKEHIEPGLIMANKALDLSRQLGDRHRQLFSLNAKAKLLFVTGDYRAYETASEALTLARELGDSETEVSLLLEISNAYGMDNDAQCREYLSLASERIRKLQNKRLEIDLLGALGPFEERKGNYYVLLTEYEGKRLTLCREIGDKLNEGFVMMFVAQIKGLYLGDTKVALEEMRKAFKLTKKVAGSIFPLLRIIQLQARMGMYDEASLNLDIAFPLGERGSYDLGRAASRLIAAMLCNERGQNQDYQEALELTNYVIEVAENSRISRQYLIAACCEATRAHLSLAKNCEDSQERFYHLQAALNTSERAVQTYQEYGFIQIIECGTEEVFYRRGMALLANGMEVEGREAIRHAYEEMMRKFELIPADSPYRLTFIENIELHRDIRSVFEEVAEKRSEHG
jgi:class 3 adenylate cyclase